MRTKAEIEAEIATLKEIKPRLPRRNVFGEDNHALVDVALDVLEDRMDNDEVYDKFGEEALGDDFNERELSEASDALRWMECEEGADAPSKGWSELAK
jgi:hypothetical protein